MGEGLKRAFAATARTRWDGTLTPEMRRFLDALAPHERPVTRKDVPGANRAQDKARQACRKLGLAEFVGGRDLTAAGWRITAAGRKALASGGLGKATAPLSLAGKTEE